MESTVAWNWSNQACVCWLVLMLTNTVTPTLTLFGSTSATWLVITPASFMRCTRRQHGVVDSWTAAARSATGVSQFSCSISSNLRSMASSFMQALSTGMKFYGAGGKRDGDSTLGPRGAALLCDD